MIAFVLSALALLTAAYYWWARNSSGHSLNNFPPGPPGLPIVGNLFLFASSSRHTVIRQYGVKFGGVFSTITGTQRVVWVTSYERFREAMIDRTWGFAGRPDSIFFKDQSTINHPGIIASGVEESSKAVRKFALITLRTLGFGKRCMQDSILQEAENVITEFGQKKGEPFNPRNVVALATANVIASITLGKTFKYGDEGMTMVTEKINLGIKQILIAARDKTFPFMKYLPNSGRTIMAEIFYSIKGFLNKIIDEHRTTHVPNEPRDFIDAWLDQQNSQVDKSSDSIYSSERLPNVLIDLFAGGFETTATTFQWLFAMMLHYPEVQQKIHQELDRVVGVNAEVTLDQRDELAYTEAVILETLRVYPLIPFAVPHQAIEDTMLGGYMIPKGTQVMMHLYSIHHDPELWEDVEVFKPERFIKDGKIVVPEYFVPFGAGRRSCIGEQLARKELFLVFANVLSNFKLELPSGAQLPSLELMQAVVLYPKPFDIVAISRK